MTEREKRTVLSVFEALTKMRYSELNTFLGSVTIREMSELYSKLKYEDYCKEHGIKYEDMTADDFADAYELGY